VGIEPLSPDLSHPDVLPVKTENKIKINKK
jgi:hypothetical protein